MHSVRILFYAINGVGLGHLNRLLAIAREARSLVHAMGLKAEFCFLTTSEAPEVAFDFPSYKIPAKNSMAQSDFNNRQYISQAKHLIANLVAGMRPHILVVDTQIEGAFGEVDFVRDHCKASVFIYRQKKPELIQDEAHQGALERYDRILIPDDPAQAEHYALQDSIQSRSCFVGRIHGYRALEALDEASLCDYFQLPTGRKIIYVSAGGGSSIEELNHLLDALSSETDYVLLVGYGPLYRGPKRYGQNIIPLTEPQISRYFKGLHGAVCAAGYNSYEELLSAEVPSLFFAQERGMDVQAERIAQGYAAGWHDILDPDRPDRPLLDCSADEIRRATRRLFASPQRAAMLQHLQQRPQAQGAQHAAVELLKLHSCIKASPIEQNSLFQYAALRQQRRSSDADWQAACYWLQLWERLQNSSLQQQMHTQAWPTFERRDAAAHAQAALAWGQRLHHSRRGLGLTKQQWIAVLKRVHIHNPDKRPQQAAALKQAFEHLLQILLPGVEQSDEAHLLGELLLALQERLKTKAYWEALKMLCAAIEHQRPSPLVLKHWLAQCQEKTELQLSDWQRLLNSARDSDGLIQTGDRYAD